MTDLDIFTYSGQQVRTVLIDNEPWFIAADVARILGYAVARDMTRSLDDDEKGERLTPTLGGDQMVSIISEPGLFKALVQRQTGRMVSDEQKSFVKGFQRLVTHEILPSINKTGSYGPAAIDLSTPQGVLALAEQLTTTARELVAVTARAEVAEEFKEAIELNDGITPREFHKKYLPGCTETEFNAALYRHRLLIDQTGQRGRDGKGRIKNGKQHRHPTYQGKAFFYLHSELDRDKIRREHVRVIPGEAELLLVKWCAARGLISSGLAVAS